MSGSGFGHRPGFFPPQGCFFLVAAPLGLGFVSYGFLTDIRHVFMMDLWMIYEGFIDDF
jgi:hypothetical protein